MFLAYPRYGGRRQVIVMVQDPAVVQALLAHAGGRAPPAAPPAPPQPPRPRSASVPAPPDLRGVSVAPDPAPSRRPLLTGRPTPAQDRGVSRRTGCALPGAVGRLPGRQEESRTSVSARRGGANRSHAHAMSTITFKLRVVLVKSAGSDDRLDPR
jgi:hypothetical protein